MPNWSAQSDDGRDLDIEYSIESHGCSSNGWDDPGEAAEISLISVIDEASGDPIKLSVSESERIEGDIRAHVESDDGAGDFDYWRDDDG